jgi:glycosyltransferase involved in cell wall biosynthesis
MIRSKPPLVSFVIPCYKLAHFLPECIRSILSQTFSDFEVLVMDDCSPDNTAEVALSFHDDRIRHIRNEQNLGPLRNYNKGVSLSRGKYIWMISADDYLRRPYVLERYVALLEEHPDVGYTFCAGVGVRDDQETGTLPYSVYSDSDRIVSGHTLLKKLLNSNIVLAASVMVRRSCYHEISCFPLDVMWAGTPVDFVWGGDWYLWCLFALHVDVGYFAEPMVCYREHELSMTNTVTQQQIDKCAAADIAVLWMIYQSAIKSGFKDILNCCLRAIASEYARHCLSKHYTWLDRSTTSSISLAQFEDSLCRSTANEEDRNWIRARVLTSLGDGLCSRGDISGAWNFYLLGLRKDPQMPKVYVKLLFLMLGRRGNYARTLLRSFRNMYMSHVFQSRR